MTAFAQTAIFTCANALCGLEHEVVGLTKHSKKTLYSFHKTLFCV